ncbi:MAG: putative esterase YcpF (UPF0227 family) [Candidatus Azotimanducaceae bacterium]|jgi:predicted esterase YcpF (UPF0227 family)
MSTLVYIHGFLSSPKSKKALQTQAWLAINRPDIDFLCPQLSSYPCEAKAQLLHLFSQYSSADTYLIGSSLGGFWSSFLIEQGLAEKAVLVNPAVGPHYRFTEFIGQTLQSYYSEDTFNLTRADMTCLKACESASLKSPQQYWLLAQKDDEVLDYRDAQRRYADSRQAIEDGGNHSFVGYERYLPDIMGFFESQE